MKRIRNLAVLSAIVAASGMAGAMEDDTAHQRHSPKEWSRDAYTQRAAERFDREDLNHDGSLSQSERRAAKERARAKKGTRSDRVREKRSGV